MGQLAAQTKLDLTRQATLESGIQLPVQCSVGQLFLKTDVSRGSILHVCTAANTWSGSGGYTAGAGIAIVGTTIATEDATVPVYYSGTGAPALDCVAGRDYYVDTDAAVLYFCKAGGSWQAVSNAGHTHAAGDIVSGTLGAGLLPAAAALSTQANTYTAGQTQTVTHDANRAGLRLAPAAGDPSSPQDGDLWYNSTTGTFRRRQNGISGDWGAGGGAVHHLLGTTHDDTAAAAPARGDLISAQGAIPLWSRLQLGAAGSYLRSNGADLVYAQIASSDLPAGYSWSNLANVPTAFAPLAHASAHLAGGSDPIPAATASARGLVMTTTANAVAVSTDDARMSNARTPTAHATTHQNGGADEIATTVPAANAIPKAGAAGVLAAGWLPAPGPASLGAVQSKDCTGVGHLLKINTDGTATCSADASGGGGGSAVTMAGDFRPFGDFHSDGGGQSPTVNTVYYFRFTPFVNLPFNSLTVKAGATSGTTHVAFAVMDANCNKVAGTDVNMAGLGSSPNWGYGRPSSGPVTLNAGSEYYFALVGEAAWSYTAYSYSANPFYFSPYEAPYFTGSNPPTGTGATLAVPAACGTKAATFDQYRPMIILSTH